MPIMTRRRSGVPSVRLNGSSTELSEWLVHMAKLSGAASEAMKEFHRHYEPVDGSYPPDPYEDEWL